jgi:small subunit ribosomal protein S27e
MTQVALDRFTSRCPEFCVMLLFYPDYHRIISLVIVRNIRALMFFKFGYRNRMRSGSSSGQASPSVRSSVRVIPKACSISAQTLSPYHQVFSHSCRSRYSITLTTNTPKARQNGMLHFRSICLKFSRNFVQTLAVDLLNPSAEHERKQHKLKRLVQSPDSYFMDVKCPGASCRARHDTINLTALFALGCFAITTVFSNAQSVVLCGSCASVLCQPTGGKARLTEGMSSNYDVFACINLNLSQVAHSGGRTR